MALSREQALQLEEFLSGGKFSHTGAVVTDLDGTVVHEHNGRTVIHSNVEGPLKHLYEMGRPVILNTLRFPLSVIRSLGKEWYDLARKAIPVILLNGSQLGFISRVNEELVFEQLHAETLKPEETVTVIRSIDRFLKAGITDFLLFYYPADWKCGEILWTPRVERIPRLEVKYKSAASVVSGSLEELETQLTQHPICMIFLLIEAPEDKLMAYQHTKKNNFITHSGVDKASGTRKMAELLDIDLEHSVGAGDSEMDNFLKETGFSIQVGPQEVRYKGKKQTVHVPDYESLGELFLKLSAHEQSNVIT
jgi:hydroxymethylpyrimidine pyrophosphatase-like HAD family hydrolase